VELTSLTAISPIDGRYADKTAALRPIFSELGLIRHRVLVEVRWLESLAANPLVAEVPALSADARAVLARLVDEFDASCGARVREIERTTNTTPSSTRPAPKSMLPVTRSPRTSVPSPTATTGVT